MSFAIPRFLDSIDHEIGSYAARDGYEIHYRRFRPVGPPEADRPKGHVLILHGIQSHSGWYVGSASHLARAGYDVVALDRRGSGMNAGARGDAPGVGTLLADVDAARSEVFRSDVVSVVGVSWGGKLAVSYAIDYPRRVGGLILSAPGLAARVGYGPWRKLAIVKAVVVSPMKLFPVPIEGAYLFTATPAALDYIRADRLSVRWITARMVRTSVAMDRMVARRAEEVSAPAFLMLAEHDRIVSNEGARRVFERFRGVVNRIKLYPGAHHTLEFEPDPSEPFADMSVFLDDISAVRPPARPASGGPQADPGGVGPPRGG